MVYVDYEKIELQKTVRTLQNQLTKLQNTDPYDRIGRQAKVIGELTDRIEDLKTQIADITTQLAINERALRDCTIQREKEKQRADAAEARLRALGF